jgi:hypothetical protein
MWLNLMTTQSSKPIIIQLLEIPTVLPSLLLNLVYELDIVRS